MGRSVHGPIRGLPLIVVHFLVNDVHRPVVPLIYMACGSDRGTGCYDCIRKSFQFSEHVTPPIPYTGTS